MFSSTNTYQRMHLNNHYQTKHFIFVHILTMSAKLVHFSDNPFIPQPDTPKNKLIYLEPLERYNKLFIDEGFTMDLPPDQIWEELDLTNSHQRSIINEFINKFYYQSSNNINYRCLYLNIAEFLNEATNCHMYFIKWKTIIIACFSIEIIDISIDGQIFKAFNGDFAIVYFAICERLQYNFGSMIQYCYHS